MFVESYFCEKNCTDQLNNYFAPYCSFNEFHEHFTIEQDRNTMANKIFKTWRTHPFFTSTKLSYSSMY